MEALGNRRPRNSRRGDCLARIVGVRRLEHAYIFGSFTLGTLSLVVLDGLAFVEAFVRRAFDGGRVEEDVSPLALDEAEALVSQFLDRSLRHANSPARHS
jgi:hypothetical protein